MQREVRLPAAMAWSPVSVLAYVLALVLSAFVTFEFCRPDLLLVGNVTIDVLESKGSRYEAPGGKCTLEPAAARQQGILHCVCNNLVA